VLRRLPGAEQNMKVLQHLDLKRGHVPTFDEEDVLSYDPYAKALCAESLICIEGRVKEGIELLTDVINRSPTTSVGNEEKLFPLLFLLTKALHRDGQRETAVSTCEYLVSEIDNTSDGKTSQKDFHRDVRFYLVEMLIEGANKGGKSEYQILQQLRKILESEPANVKALCMLGMRTTNNREVIKYGKRACEGLFTTADATTEDFLTTCQWLKSFSLAATKKKKNATKNPHEAPLSLTSQMLRKLCIALYEECGTEMNSQHRERNVRTALKWLKRVIEYNATAFTTDLQLAYIDLKLMVDHQPQGDLYEPLLELLDRIEEDDSNIYASDIAALRALIFLKLSNVAEVLHLTDNLLRSNKFNSDALYIRAEAECIGRWDSQGSSFLPPPSSFLLSFFRVSELSKGYYALITGYRRRGELRKGLAWADKGCTACPKSSKLRAAREKIKIALEKETRDNHSPTDSNAGSSVCLNRNQVQNKRHEPGSHSVSESFEPVGPSPVSAEIGEIRPDLRELQSRANQADTMIRDDETNAQAIAYYQKTLTDLQTLAQKERLTEQQILLLARVHMKLAAVLASTDTTWEYHLRCAARKLRLLQKHTTKGALMVTEVQPAVTYLTATLLTHEKLKLTPPAEVPATLLSAVEKLVSGYTEIVSAGVSTPTQRDTIALKLLKQWSARRGAQVENRDLLLMANIGVSLGDIDALGWIESLNANRYIPAGKEQMLKAELQCNRGNANQGLFYFTAVLEDRMAVLPLEEFFDLMVRFGMKAALEAGQLSDIAKKARKTYEKSFGSTKAVLSALLARVCPMVTKSWDQELEEKEMELVLRLLSCGSTLSGPEMDEAVAILKKCDFFCMDSDFVNNYFSNCGTSIILLAKLKRACGDFPGAAELYQQMVDAEIVSSPVVSPTEYREIGLEGLAYCSGKLARGLPAPEAGRPRANSQQQCYDEMIQQFPHNALTASALFYKAVEAMRESGDFQKALLFLSRVKLLPTTAGNASCKSDAVVLGVEVCLIANDWEQAGVWLNDVVEPTGYALYLKAYWLYHRDTDSDCDAALVIVEKVVEQLGDALPDFSSLACGSSTTSMPLLPEVLALKANILFSKNSILQASEAIEAGLEIDGPSPPLLHNSLTVPPQYRIASSTCLLALAFAFLPRLLT